MKINSVFWLNLIEFCLSPVGNKIGSGNGLVPIRQQAIAWTYIEQDLQAGHNKLTHWSLGLMVTIL